MRVGGDMNKKAKVKAQKGLLLLKEAVLEIVEQYPDGIGNSDIARILCIESDYQERSINYLSYSILGLLVNEGKIDDKKIGHGKFFQIRRVLE